MENCLVTPLNGVVSDDALLKLNELRITYTGSGARIRLSVSIATTIEASGDMTIDDVNVGRSYSLAVDTQKDIYCPQNTVLSIPNKFAIKYLAMWAGTDVDAQELGFNTQLSCAPCCTANTSDFRSFQGVRLGFGNANITGDIANLRSFVMNYMTQESSLFVSGVYGSIDCLLGLNKILPVPSLSAKNEDITGDIVSVLATATNTMLSGQWIYLSGLRGDLSLMKENFYYMNSSSHYTWKNTRPSTYPIIMFNNVELDGDVDAMLINQANCTLADSSHYMDGSTLRMTINVKGSHTPGTTVNAAIKALIALGITVKVNNVTLTGDET